MKKTSERTVLFTAECCLAAATTTSALDGRRFTARTKLYKVWSSMKHRCLNTQDKQYKDYGGRGITVSKRWLKFKNFLADMGERPVGMTLDRKNNDRGYMKSNCRWATRKEQQQNRRGSNR